MLKDRLVRVKLKKRYHEQRPMSYVGKVTAFSDFYIVMEAKSIMLVRSQSNGVQIDPHVSAQVIPRDNVESVQVLPDNFDMKNLTVSTNGQQLVLVVDGKRDAYIGELGEG